jgi:hypothetical protein
MGKVRNASKERQWRRLIREQVESGKSVALFCGGRLLPVHQFYWWQRTLRQRDVRADSKHRRSETGFVPVRLPVFAAMPIEVVHPRGCVVRVPIGFDPVSLRRVLETLGPCQPDPLEK